MKRARFTAAHEPATDGRITKMTINREVAGISDVLRDKHLAYFVNLVDNSYHTETDQELLEKYRKSQNNDWLGILLGTVLKLGLAFAMLGLFAFAWFV